MVDCLFRCFRDWFDNYSIGVLQERREVSTSNIHAQRKAARSNRAGDAKDKPPVGVVFSLPNRNPAYGKACADGGDKSLQYVDCVVEGFYSLFLHHNIFAKKKLLLVVNTVKKRGGDRGILMCTPFCCTSLICGVK